MIIDLRSDTVTKPTSGMMDAMFNAKVGDDVFGEDPSVNMLQEKTASIFGHEAGLFCSSGTMTNQLAIKTHTRPGDEIIASSMSHIYLFEGGGVAANSGVSIKMIEGDRGRLTVDGIRELINPDDAHFPRTKMVCLEDTMNKGGGAIYDLEEIKRIRKFCNVNNLILHLDGARVFNSLVETGIDPVEYGSYFDSISICFSKGLGCPVGSVLIGKKDFIYQAHRYRKTFGGGMRQAGYLAAAGLYALENNIERLKEDHSRAKKIGDLFDNHPLVESVVPVKTNIVILNLKSGIDSADVVVKFKSKNLLVTSFGPTKIRFVTHLDFDDDQLEEVKSRVI